MHEQYDGNKSKAYNGFYIIQGIERKCSMIINRNIKSCEETFACYMGLSVLRLFYYRLCAVCCKPFLCNTIIEVLICS